MGSTVSKKKEPKEASSSSSRHSSSNSNSNNSNSSNSNSKSPLVPDLAAYETALHRDPSLQSFDNILRDRTTSVIESVSTAPSFSLDSIRHVTGSLADINEQVVKLILKSKEDIWKNPDLHELVKDYFDNSTQTLTFYSTLEKSLNKIRNSHIYIQLAIARFQEEKTQPGEEQNRFSKTLQELENFSAAGDPFTEEFFAVLRSVYEQQVAMLVKLQAKKNKLDKKLKGLKSYRKVSNVLMGAAFAAIVICSVVAAAIAAPPLVAALVAASSAPLGVVGKWVNSLWNGYQKGVKDELDLVFDMEIETFIAVKELESIRVLVEKLKIEVQSMLFKAGFAVNQADDVGVTMAIEEIKTNLGVFMQVVDVLGEHSDKFSRDIRRARAVILHRIIKFPSSV